MDGENTEGTAGTHPGRSFAEAGGGVRIPGLLASCASTGGDDRVHCSRLPDGSLIAIVADGATGVGMGRFASGEFVRSILRNFTAWPAADSGAGSLSDAFATADRDIKALRLDCDTTGIVMLVRETGSGMNHEYMLASAGDSEGYMMTSEGPTELTKSQVRKPRIGSGVRTVRVRGGAVTGAIVLGSDGLFMLGAVADVFALNGVDAGEVLRRHVANYGFKAPDDACLVLVTPER